MTTTDLTQEQKDRLSMLVREEIGEIYDMRYKNQMILDINIGKPPLEDEQKEQKRQDTINTYKDIIAFFTRNLKELEDIQKKLNE